MNSNPRINKLGTKIWYDENGEIHRDDDLPAIEWVGGDKAWYKHGHRHREQDKPAIENANGGKMWYKNGTYLVSHEVEALKHKWTAIRNGNTDLLTEELLNEL